MVFSGFLFGVWVVVLGSDMEGGLWKRAFLSAVCPFGQMAGFTFRVLFLSEGVWRRFWLARWKSRHCDD